jgi:hypothetical protein
MTERKAKATATADPCGMTDKRGLVEEDAFPPGADVGVDVVVEAEGFFLFGERCAVEGGEGVGDAEAVSVGGAVFFGDEGVGFAHAGGAGGEVVGVGGEEVDPAVGEELVGEGLGFAAHLAEDGAGGDLDEEAVAHPLGQACGVALEGGVALGVGEDGDHAGVLEFVKGFAEGGGEGEVGEFDEEVGVLVEGVFGGVGEGVVDVFVEEMEVAAGGEGERDGLGFEGGLEFSEAGVVEGGVEVPVAAGVGGGDDMGDAVIGGHAGHGDGGFEVGRAVVEGGEEMMVDVDHRWTSVPLTGVGGLDDEDVMGLCKLLKQWVARRAA